MSTAAAPTSALISQAQTKTEAYLPRIDSQRAHTVGSTDLEGAFPYEKKYVGTSNFRLGEEAGRAKRVGGHGPDGLTGKEVWS